MSGTATVAQYQTALRSVTYANSSEAFGSGPRTVSFSVQDSWIAGGSESRDITLIGVNDAPSLSSGAAVSLTGTNEDTPSPATSVNSVLTSAGWSDVDGAAPRGMALVGTSGNGTWQFSTDGSTWVNVGTVSASSALLLDSASQLRYVPDGANGETAGLSFRAWDQNSGSASTHAAPMLANPAGGGGTSAFSAEVASASLLVQAVNDAPVITSASLALSEGQTLTLSPGDMAVSDPDSVGFSFAVSGVSGGFFQLIQAVGTPITSFNSAQLANGWVQFVDDGDETPPAFSLTASDGLLNSNTWAVNISYASVNDAPILSGAGFTLDSIDEDDLNSSGQTVASLLANGGAGAASDDESSSNLGLAVVAASPGNGTWQYSLDAGATWQSISNVADGNALLLGSNDRVRLVPNGLQPTTASLGLRAWDGTWGSAGDRVAVGSTGGTSAFSANPATATIAVRAVNDAPTTASVSLGSITEDSGALRITQAELLVSAQDLDGDTLTAQDLRISTGAGTLINNGDGSWAFTAQPDFNGAVALEFTISDGVTQTKGAATLAVTPVNDAPKTWPLVLRPILEDSGLRILTPSELLVGASDVDGNALTVQDLRISSGSGILVDRGDGSWTYEPASNDNGSVAFSYRISDGRLSTEASATLAIQPVNDAPTLRVAGQTGDAELSHRENTELVLTASATDADHSANALRFAIAGGADAALFTLDSLTGELRFTQAPDFEAPKDANADGIYDVRLRVNDPDGAQDELTLRVRVGDVNDPPVLVMSASVQLSAQPQPYQVVATVAAADQDLGDTLRFNLLEDAGGRFAIDARSGEIRFTGAAPASQGGGTTHNLVVAVTDSAGESRLRALALFVPGVVATTDTPSAVTTTRPPAAAAEATPSEAPVKGEEGASPPAEGTWVASEMLSFADGNATAERLASLLRDLQSADAEVRLQPRDANSRSFASESVVALPSTADGPNRDAVLQAIAALSSSDGDAQSRRLDDLLGRQWSSGRRNAEDGIEGEQDALTGGSRKGAAETVDQLLLRFTQAQHVAGVSFSVGLVWWLTRGGGLLATAIMGAPAWKQVDLLAVMVTNNEADDPDTEDDELEEVNALFQRSREISA